jgi:DAACS family dicarboxylate/amino acid:cation (Na+ or H+) symporter
VTEKPQDPSGPDAFERELTTDLKDTTSDPPKGWPLHTRILLGLAIGVLSGLAVNAVWGGDHPGVVWVVYHVTEPVGTLFLRALLMIVVPLIASSLIVGVAGIGDVRKLGRVGVRSLVYFLVI